MLRLIPTKILRFGALVMSYIGPEVNLQQLICLTRLYHFPRDSRYGRTQLSSWEQTSKTLAPDIQWLSGDQFYTEACLLFGLCQRWPWTECGLLSRIRTRISSDASIMISWRHGYGCSKVIKSPRIPLCCLPFFPALELCDGSARNRKWHGIIQKNP
jgi:hypothetical protein